MPSYWIQPKEFEMVMQQNLARYYDTCVNRRKLFKMLRDQLWLYMYLSMLGMKPCNLYLPEYGFDLATLIVCDAIRPFLPSLMNPAPPSPHIEAQ